MRLDDVYSSLLEDQISYYDRMYTLSSGKEHGWPRPLSDSRKDFIENRFQIIQKPFVEGIPKYHKDEGWTWKNLSDGASGNAKLELDKLSELLDFYTEWTPYPHQIDSIKAWQEGKHVVVATGTGSGKTECFLYPMLGHIMRESLRNAKNDQPMERGVKAIVLYPMNALVADQTVRIRDLFGKLEMAKILENLGAKRPCQFGMYTGRTPSHGWYSKPGSKGKWNLKRPGPREKVKSIVSKYEKIEENHPELWSRLVRDKRVPAKGGSWEYSENGAFTWEDVPDSTLVPEGVSKEDARFKAVDNWTMKDFSEGLSSETPGFKKDLKFLGTEGDRELYSRYEMHQGGLIQYALQSSNPSQEERDLYAAATQQLGVPDILVTNYSMLEYMLLRPLEHVFWEDTKQWLNGEVDDGEPPRKLLLVLDEAHLYQGAMGTEVSMLISRLKSVLSTESGEPDIQVIITSASLGQDDELKKEFVSNLTGVEKENVAVPKPARTDRIQDKEWHELMIPDNLEDLAKLEVNSETMNFSEYRFLSSLNFDNEIKTELEKHFSNKSENINERMELRFNILEKSDIFIKLYTALHHPKHIPEDKANLLPNGIKSSPWSIENLAEIIFDKRDTNLISRLLDLIAASRLGKTDENIGVPLMPIRGHIFSRGLPRLSVCPRCAEFHKLDTTRCDNIVDGEECFSKTYELVYGRSTGVAFLNLWVERLDHGTDRDSLKVSEDFQYAWSNSTSTNSDAKRVALAAWRCDPNTEKGKFYTHVLDLYKGRLIPRIKFNDDSFDAKKHAHLKVAGFSTDGKFESSNLWLNKNNREDPEFFDRKCPATERDHTHRLARQVSNLETRGNEAFSGIINQLMHKQDVAKESRHLPNKGKKCLVFSDSRQQAANISVELGQLSNHDEARKVLFEMLLSDWFKSLDSSHKSVSWMFPWYTLFCASKGINPFAGGDYYEDREMFVDTGVNAICSIIASYACKWNDNLEIDLSDSIYDVEEKINQSKPHTKLEFKFEKIEFFARKVHIEDYLNECFPRILKTRIDSKKHELVETLLKKLKNYDNKDEYLANVEVLLNDEKEKNSTWLDYHQVADQVFNGLEKSCTEDISKQIFFGVFKAIKVKIVEEWLLTADQLKSLAEYAIDISKDVRFRMFTKRWNNIVNQKIPIHKMTYGRWTDGWSKFILRIMYDGEYGIEEIGLGYPRITEKFWNKIDETWREMMPEARQLIPKMLGRSFKGPKAYEIQFALFSDSRMQAFDPAINAHADPYNPNRPGTKTLDECLDIMKNLYKEKTGKGDMVIEGLIQDLREKKIIHSPQGQGGLNADAIEIVPDIDSFVKICEMCYKPRLSSYQDNSKCGSCDNEKFIDADSSEFAMRYQKLRVQPWRKSITDIITNKNEILLLRAEEHTAQIGDKLNTSDLYSPAELHELQFQDIPVPDSTSADDRSSLPPIDILSCTTTMEVGIDIGSLTSVALRSMPPHSANYQQRIGRAGRGAAEVSIALTWADNSAYAQQLFEKPQRLLFHPDEPPSLYMDNKRIAQRHFQASLLQLFMKRKKYIRDLLIFEGMTKDGGIVTPNMVESLGNIDEFFSEEDSQFGVVRFLKWLQNEVDNDFLMGKMNLNQKDVHVYQKWKDDFINNLLDYRRDLHGE